MPTAETSAVRLLTIVVLLLTQLGWSQDLGQLRWLSGTWTDSETQEHWSLPAGATMMGFNRKVSDGKTVFFEYLRIEENRDGITYWASPLGKSWTPFRLKRLDKHEVLFENPAHDFPHSNSLST